MLRYLFPVCVLLSAMLCAPASAWEKKPVLWVSHRGESWEAPENTVKAFELARQGGSDGCECDARLSKEGKVVLSHDSSTKRMSGVDLQIAEHPAEELRKVNVAGKFRAKTGFAQIPYLQEIFPIIGPGRFLTIELKSACPQLVTAIKELLPASGVKPEQIEFCCFSAKLCKYTKATLPEHRVLWVTIGKESLTLEKALETLQKIKADGISIYWRSPLLTKENVQKFHDHGYLVLAWTVDTPDTARKMIEMGVDVLTSNCASKLKKQFAGK